jgi:predicted transposase YdaD
MSQGPHDTLVKYVFGHPPRAAALLRAALPAALAARVDWSTLRLDPASYVDDSMRELHSDLVYRVRLRDGRHAWCCVIFEHQSTPDPLMAVRLLIYSGRFYERVARAEGADPRIPILIPVVMHHGRGSWPHATTLTGLFDADPATIDALGDLGPRLGFLVDDLGALDDDALARRAADVLAMLGLQLLRDARTVRDLETLVRTMVGGVRALDAAPSGRDALRAVFQYLLRVRSEPPAELVRVIDVLGEELGSAKETAMNTAEQLVEMGRREGEAKGRTEGRNEGRADALRGTLLKLLVLRFGPVPADVAARIDAADADTLDRWTERVLAAASANDVVAP